jgi:hypothetical protein
MTDDTERRPDGRFPPNRSGNPRGRPSKNKTVGAAIIDAMNQTITANDNGRKRKITKVQAAATQIANKGAAGDMRAGKILLDLAAKAEERETIVQPSMPMLTLSDREIVDRFLADHQRWIEEGRL